MKGNIYIIYIIFFENVFLAVGEFLVLCGDLAVCSGGILAEPLLTIVINGFYIIYTGIYKKDY